MSVKCPKCGSEDNLTRTWDAKTHEFKRIKCFNCGADLTKDQLRILELEAALMRIKTGQRCDKCIEAHKRDELHLFDEYGTLHDCGTEIATKALEEKK